LRSRKHRRRDAPGARIEAHFSEAGGGVYIANESFRREDAEQVLQAGEADAVAWGKQFIANPDLPRRFALGAPLNEPDASTFYAAGPQGYTDYPTLESAQQHDLVTAQ
jgi:2,4-dienoyl-CoA reductase-like NADH-dependent reductase (Old Yellow Enzyme family)